MLDNYPTTNLFIIAEGITPNSQLLYKLINKIWKGYFCGGYDGFILTVPIN